MKRMGFFILVCLFSFHGGTSFAQKENDNDPWMLQQGDSRYIFADTAYVRISADTKTAPVDTLLTGEDLTVTAITAQKLTLKGITAPWLQIKYKKNGLDKEGFLWQGLISFTPVRRGDTKFIYAVNRCLDTTIKEDDVSTLQRRWQVTLKIVQTGKLMDTRSFWLPDREGVYYSQPKVMSGLGLSNVQNIVAISLGGTACGVAADYFYYAWMNDNRLAFLPGRMEVSDAGAYAHIESFIFPAEKNGAPDMIIFNTHDETATEKADKKGDPIFKNKDASEKYSWDGSNGTFKKITK